MVQLTATAFSLICAGVILFQVCLICGASWGHLTQGGRVSGTLDTPGRVAAGLSIVLLSAMAAAVMSAADMQPHWPAWTAWTALVIQSLSTIMNWITPSRPERLLWGPITSVMLLLILLTMFGS